MNRRELIQAMLAAPLALAVPTAVGAVASAHPIEPLVIRVGPGIPGKFIWFGGLRETTTALGPNWSDGHRYEYDADFAVAIAEGPMKEGISRIWADCRCIYDKRPRQIGETEEDYRTRVLLTFEISKRLTIYPGTETQPASPLIESYVGAGRCSTFRGLHYVTMEKFPVEQYGNRVPEFSFETA